jgi:hypothetical protein
MKVKELIERLQEMPPDVPVGFNGEGRVELSLAGNTLHSRVVHKVVGVHQLVLGRIDYNPPSKPPKYKRTRTRKLACVLLNPTMEQIDGNARRR